VTSSSFVHAELNLYALTKGLF